MILARGWGNPWPDAQCAVQCYSGEGVGEPLDRHAGFFLNKFKFKWKRDSGEGVGDPLARRAVRGALLFWRGGRGTPGQTQESRADSPNIEADSTAL